MLIHTDFFPKIKEKPIKHLKEIPGMQSWIIENGKSIANWDIIDGEQVPRLLGTVLCGACCAITEEMLTIRKKKGESSYYWNYCPSCWEKSVSESREDSCKIVRRETLEKIEIYK